MLDQIFERNDKNGDGVIAPDEVDQSRPAWNWLKVHDTNEDGKLELEEVRKSLHSELDKSERSAESKSNQLQIETSD